MARKYSHPSRLREELPSMPDSYKHYLTVCLLKSEISDLLSLHDEAESVASLMRLAIQLAKEHQSAHRTTGNGNGKTHDPIKLASRREALLLARNTLVEYANKETERIDNLIGGLDQLIDT